MKISINIPVQVFIPRKTKSDKKFIINLNNYRNSHYITLNEAKKLYKKIVESELENINISFDSVYLIFVHHPKHNNIDTANVLSIAEKFACDAIQPNIIKNDSRREIMGHFYFPGELSNDPYVEMHIIDNREEFLMCINNLH